jgi:succinate dehydrogenase/fumarate reductase flavoprotein subunit
MWQKVGIIRRGKTMEEALSQIEELKASSVRITAENSRDLIRLIEFKNMLLLSEMVCRAALMRNESRGAHFREDNPQEETEWLKNIIIRNREGKMTLETFDVLFDRVPIR